ncbi:MAG: glycoside hydrolase family 3 protein [Erysipelotrichaceae bacterium]
MKQHILSKFPFGLTTQQIETVETKLNNMTLDEKLAQLFCLILYDNEKAALDKILAFAPGGVMLRPMGCEQAVEIVNYLQKQSKVPMFIAANLEKGGSGVVHEGTQVNSPMGIAATQDTRFATDLGHVCGVEGQAVGVNWAFAPIVDIDYNFRNPITNTRTFGSNPSRVADMGAAYISEIQKHNVAACAKHFPGDGTDERDQHLVTAFNTLSVEAWRETYGEVYKAAIQAGSLTVMMGHFLFKAYEEMMHPGIQEEAMLPASLNRDIIETLLRDELNFNGLVITDSTTMGGFLAAMPRERAVPLAIASGCDMFLFSYNLEEDFNSMKQGYLDGVITEERLHTALTRVLGLKMKLNLWEESVACPTLENAKAKVGTVSFADISSACHKQAITLVKEEAGVLPLAPKKYPRVLLHGIEPSDGGLYGNRTDSVAYFKQQLEQQGFVVSLFTPHKATEGSLPPMKSILEQYDLIIYVANLATKSNQTTIRIEWMSPMGANLPIFTHSIPTIFISLENPYHLLDAPMVKTFINTYSSSNEAIQQLVEKLMGQSKFVGKSPVDPFCNL